MLNPTRLKGMALRRVRAEEFQREPEGHTISGRFFWSDDVDTPYHYSTALGFFLPQIAQPSCLRQQGVAEARRAGRFMRQKSSTETEGGQSGTDERATQLLVGMGADGINIKDHGSADVAAGVFRRGPVAPRVHARTFVLRNGLSLKVVAPVQAADVSEDQQEATKQANSGKASAAASGEGGRCAGGRARRWGIHNDDPTAGVGEQALDGGAGPAGANAAEKKPAEKIAPGQLEHHAHQQGRLKARRQLMSLRVGGFKCAGASSVDMKKRHGRDSDRLEASRLDKTPTKTLLLLLDAQHCDTRYGDEGEEKH
eukprot:g16432.t1